MGQGIMSREIPKLQDADALTRCGRQHPDERNRELAGNPARSVTLARSHTSSTEVGRSRVLPRASPLVGRIGKSKDRSR